MINKKSFINSFSLLAHKKKENPHNNDILVPHSIPQLKLGDPRRQAPAQLRGGGK